MPARRCDIGCQSWPDEPIFTHCVHCGELTTRVRNIEPDIDRDEARSLKLHELFDKFYALVCAQRGIPADGPLEADPEPIPERGQRLLDPPEFEPSW